MDDDFELTPEQQGELLLNVAKQFYRSMGDLIELAARVDGLEVLIAELGSRAGISPDEIVSRLREVQATAHQKRLQDLEDRNPAAAAGLDNRAQMPPIDDDLLKKMKFGEWPQEGDEDT